MVHTQGAGGHLLSVNPTHRPFGWSVVARLASNGGDLFRFETANDGSTEQSENHEDPRWVEARGGAAAVCGGKLADG